MNTMLSKGEFDAINNRDWDAYKNAAVAKYEMVRKTRMKHYQTRTVLAVALAVASVLILISHFAQAQEWSEASAGTAVSKPVCHEGKPSIFVQPASVPEGAISAVQVSANDDGGAWTLNIRTRTEAGWTDQAGARLRYIVTCGAPTT